MIRLFVILLVLLVAGCSGSSETPDEENVSLPRELEEIVEEVEIEEVWQESVSEGQGDHFLKLEMAISGDALFVADRKGLVLALDKSTGDVRWEVETKLPISGGLEVGEENLFFGTTNAEIVGLKLDDGDTSWTSRVSSEVLATPRYAEGQLIARSIDGAITALDAGEGEKLWSYIRDVPALSLRGTSSPVIKSGGVISGYANGQLVVLRLKDGMQIWETSVAVARGRGALSRMVDVDGDPLAADKFIYAGTFNGGVVAVDIRSGQIVWRRSEMSSYKKMAADWVSLFIVDVSDHIWSVSQDKGETNWQQPALENRQLTPVTQVGQYLVTADFEGYIHVLSASTGELIGRSRVGRSAISVAPLFDGELIYVQDSDGEITAFRINDIVAEED